MDKLNVYEIEAIFLDMGQGQSKKYKQIHAKSIEDAISSCYKQYMTIEIITVKKIGEK